MYYFPLALNDMNFDQFIETNIEYTDNKKSFLKPNGTE